MAKKKRKRKFINCDTNVDGVDASRGVGAAAKRDTATVFPRDGGTADSLRNHQRLFFDEEEEEDLDFSTRG